MLAQYRTSVRLIPPHAISVLEGPHTVGRASSVPHISEAQYGHTRSQYRTSHRAIPPHAASVPDIA
eukprot:3321284-Rhodomonas_salina.1